jgi:hypothetical protein
LAAEPAFSTAVANAAVLDAHRPGVEQVAAHGDRISPVMIVPVVVRFQR